MVSRLPNSNDVKELWGLGVFRGDPGEERLGGFTMAGYLFGFASQLHLLVGLLGFCARLCESSHIVVTYI